MNTVSKSQAPFSSTLVVNGSTYIWQDGEYRTPAGVALDLEDRDVKKAFRKAGMDVARRIIEASLEDEHTLNHLPEPHRIREGILLSAGTGSLSAGIAVGRLVAAARESGDWRPLGLDVLSADIISRSSDSKRVWNDLRTLSGQLQELADLELIVIWKGNVHFTEALIKSLPSTGRKAA